MFSMNLSLKSTNLRVSDWFGETIAFGDQIRFVCERGYFFEEDPSQIDVKYTCQDGKAKGMEGKRGFFDVPELETDWPRCLLGESYKVRKNYTYQCFHHFSSTLSKAPGDA